MASLMALTALGAREPAQVTRGGLTITERTDVALASVAARKGRMVELATAAQGAGVPLPDPARHQAGAPYGAFWVAPDMWLVEAPFATHELIADLLRSALGDAASITEQTDALAPRSVPNSRVSRASVAFSATSPRTSGRTSTASTSPLRPISIRNTR